MKEYTQVTLRVEPQQQQILIALLSKFPFETFEEEGTRLNAYIPSSNLDADELEAYLQAIPAFASVKPTYETYQPKNWNEEWQKNFQPIRIDHDIVVRAPFHEKQGEVTYEILIDPRMSFGTGHHATTSLVLHLMKRENFAQRYVVDFGCGTGILAIFAAMQGARPVVAFDNNEWAYDNAPVNCQLNSIHSIEIKLAEAHELEQHQPDVLLANINRSVLVEHMTLMAGQLQPGGSLYLSGILTRDQDEIKRAAVKEGLRHMASAEEEEWAALRYVKPEQDT